MSRLFLLDLVTADGEELAVEMAVDNDTIVQDLLDKLKATGHVDTVLEVQSYPHKEGDPCFIFFWKTAITI